MKLKELTIPNYKGFVNFTTTFDQNSPTTTVIGQNGVGKSNLIEIIVLIFRSIDLGEKTEFSYTLIYECRGHDVQVRFDVDDAKKNIVNIDGVKKSAAYLKNNASEYLPMNVFTYYSGTNWRVEQLFLKHQTQFYKRLTDGEESLLRRFFYCRDVHSFFVLLAFLVDEDSACKDILEKLDIESLDSVLFCLKKPYWFKNKPSEIMLKEGDPRFWYSRGVVKDFLNNLWDQSIAPIDNKESKTIDFRGRTENQERLYMFLPDRSSLVDLKDKYANTADLFKNIESTYIADILESVEVTVTLKNGKQLTFDQLSEGERQLLTVLGLMKFTRDDESLFLLDEPDTHLNPRWKLDYFKQIEKILNHKIDGGDKTAWDSSQIILTTHDPIMLTSLHASQIRVLTETAGVKSSEIPEEDPINMGVEAIIQSGLYGLRTSLDDSIQEKIDMRNRLLSMSELTDKQSERLDELNRELDEAGLSHAHPNPYFSNFAKAISRNPKFRKPEFTSQEYNELQDMTDELLSEILQEEAKDDSN
ncbi:MAG: AAA family ATPase [Cocleimonas sp.]